MGNCFSASKAARDLDDEEPPHGVKQLSDLESKAGHVFSEKAVETEVSAIATEELHNRTVQVQIASSEALKTRKDSDGIGSSQLAANTAFERDVERLQAFVATQKDNGRSQATTIAELNNTTQTQKTTIATHAESIETQRAMITTHEGTIETQQATIAALESTIASQKATIATHKDTIKTQLTTIETLDSSLDSQCQALEASHPDFKARHTEIEELKGAKAMAEDALQSQLATILTLESTIERQSKAQEASRRDLKAQIEELKRAKAAAEQETERVRRQVASAISSDDEEIKRARLKIRQLEARIVALEGANNRLYAESASLKTLVAELTRSSSSRDETTRKLAAELLVSKGVPVQDWYEGRGSSGGLSSSSMRTMDFQTRGPSSSSMRVTDSQWYNLC
jgi:chromosome segregation ATPase